MTDENKDKTLEEKLKDVKLKMKGVGKLLESYDYGSFGITYQGSPQDVKYLENGRYKVVATKWEEHSWSEHGGGIEWTGWISLCYNKKGKREIAQEDTEYIVTRDMHDQKKDKRDLWSYDFVSIKATGSNTVEVAWADKNGNKGPTYEIELE